MSNKPDKNPGEIFTHQAEFRVCECGALKVRYSLVYGHKSYPHCIGVGTGSKVCRCGLSYSAGGMEYVTMIDVAESVFAEYVKDDEGPRRFARMMLGTVEHDLKKDRFRPKEMRDGYEVVADAARHFARYFAYSLGRIAGNASGKP